MKRRNWSKPLTTYRFRKGKVEVVNWIGRVKNSIVLDKTTRVIITRNNILGHGNLLISKNSQKQKWENITGVFKARDTIQDYIFDLSA